MESTRLPKQEPNHIGGFPLSLKEWAGLLVLAIIVVGASMTREPPVVEAQTGGRKPTSLTFVVQTRPLAIPTSPTDVIQQDCYVCYLDLEGTGQNIIVKDRQATPIEWFNNVLGAVSSKTTWIYSAPSDPSCRWMPNGVTWSADGAGATGYITIKCPTGPCTLYTGQ